MAISALVSVTNGSAAAQALTTSANIGTGSPGETITVALTTSTGVQDWSCTPNSVTPSAWPNLPVPFVRRDAAGGFSFTFTMPQNVQQISYTSVVTDNATNPQSFTFTIISTESASVNISALVRGVAVSNIAALTAFTVADTDLTFVQGDRILLTGQTTGAENGIYDVGLVTTGTAPLTRAGDMPSGAVLRGGMRVFVSEGTTFANTTWFLANAGNVTVGTTTMAQAATTGWFPSQVVLRTAMTNGTATIATVPVRALTRIAVQGCAAVLGGVRANTTGFATGVTTTGAEGITIGKVGTAAIICMWIVAAGTVNAADTSTAQLTISQQ